MKYDQNIEEIRISNYFLSTHSLIYLYIHPPFDTSTHILYLLSLLGMRLRIKINAGLGSQSALQGSFLEGWGFARHLDKNIQRYQFILGA
jgi:hypothetical protein